MAYRILHRAFCLLLLASVAGTAAHASNYSDTVFFDNSVSPRSYFYSQGKASAPSTLTLIDTKLPLDTVHFISGPNALKLQWQSVPDGSWDLAINLPMWPTRYIDFTGDSLYLWLYSATPLSASAMPKIALRDEYNMFSVKLPLGEFAHDLPAAAWTRVRIPIARFSSDSVHPFQPRRTNSIILLQNAADNAPHMLLIDDIRIEDAAAARTAAPSAPAGLVAKGYERHVQLTWSPSSGDVSQYVIYRSENGGAFHAIGVQRPGVERYMDFVGKPPFTASYRITARTSAMKESLTSNTVQASTHEMSDDELLTMVQEASFQYYWSNAEPHSGLARESTPGDEDMVAMGGSGFGVMALIVGAERGFAPREAVVDRMLRITDYLAHADRYHGAWPHFLSGRSGHIVTFFGLYDDGADIVETSFMMQGLLAARGYFTQDTPKERQLRQNITTLWQGVDWDWFRATPEKDALYWHWSPDFGFRITNRLQGWNETMITYLLGIASPTHPLPPSTYHTGYTAEGNPSHPYGVKQVYYGIPVWMNQSGSPGPLFFTHYSFMGYDPRGVRDKYANYFDNNRNSSLVQQKYAIENPKHFIGYGADAWGMSAVGGPRGYHEYKPFTEDDGTLAPTAAVSAYAYAPQESMLAIRHFYRDLGAELWDVYGFRNAFNQTQDWYCVDELALNQGPQVVMIENGRNGMVWHAFMSNPEIAPMQKAIGLVPDPAPAK